MAKCEDLNGKGSPPPMRGTLMPELSDAVANGITPAHAGNTHLTIDRASEIKDHPRPCGEHMVVVVNDVTALGSPPPMRGTHLKDPIKTLCQAIKFSEFIHFGCGVIFLVG